MDVKKLKQKVGKRCQTPQVRDIPESQTVSVCVCDCIHMFLQVSLPVCLSLPPHCGILGCVCVCHGKRVREEESECGGLCLCLFGQCVGLMEVSSHPGLMATQLRQFSGILRVDYDVG